MMDQKYLSEIKAREQAATPGPWVVDAGEQTVRATDIENQPIMADYSMRGWGEDNNIKNAEFIAHSRTDIPALITEVERLTIENLGLKDAAIRCDGYEKRYHAALTELDAKDQQIATLKDFLKAVNNRLISAEQACREQKEEADQQIAMLKKALELMATYLVHFGRIDEMLCDDIPQPLHLKYQPKNDGNYENGPCIQCVQEYFQQQAQEQEGKK